MTITGITLSAIVIVFCLFDGVSKLFKPKPVVESTLALGFPVETIRPLGITIIICTALYAIPQTTILGAILLTGYLGGAVASNVRVASPPFNTMFPALFAVLAWAGLMLREPALMALLVAH